MKGTLWKRKPLGAGPVAYFCLPCQFFLFCSLGLPVPTRIPKLKGGEWPEECRPELEAFYFSFSTKVVYKNAQELYLNSQQEQMQAVCFPPARAYYKFLLCLNYRPANLAFFLDFTFQYIYKAPTQSRPAYALVWVYYQLGGCTISQRGCTISGKVWKGVQAAEDVPSAQGKVSITYRV